MKQIKTREFLAFAAVKV